MRRWHVGAAGGCLSLQGFHLNPSHMTVGVALSTHHSSHLATVTSSAAPHQKSSTLQSFYPAHSY